MGTTTIEEAEAKYEAAQRAAETAKELVGADPSDANSRTLDEALRARRNAYLVLLHVCRANGGVLSPRTPLLTLANDGDLL